MLRTVHLSFIVMFLLPLSKLKFKQLRSSLCRNLPMSLIIFLFQVWVVLILMGHFCDKMTAAEQRIPSESSSPFSVLENNRFHIILYPVLFISPI